MADPNVEKGSTDKNAPVPGVVVGEETSDVAVLTVADIKAECPRAGSEIAVAFKFKIAWVRDALDALRGALTALGITIADRRDPGECKAALSKYYEAPNATTASRAEAPQAQGGTDGADGPHEDSDAGATGTAGSGNVSAGTAGAAAAAEVTHAAMRQQLEALQRQLC